MSAASFKAFQERARLRVSEIGRTLKPAKGRTTYNRPGQQPVRVAIIPRRNPHDHAAATVPVDPARVMALDLSTAKCGLAWGRAGEKPEGTLQMVTPRELDKGPEAAMLRSIAEALAAEAVARRCGQAVLSEFYASKNMIAFRANSSLRGAVMAALQSRGIPCAAIPEITARKAAGVDLSKPGDNEEPKGYMKRRAHAFLETKDLGHLAEDEGDAAILLMGCKAIIDGEKEAR